MSFCTKCGSEVDDELTICSYCGAKIERKTKLSPTIVDEREAEKQMKKYEIEPDDRPVYEKNIKLYFILGFVTCGIFFLYWEACICNDMNRLTKTKGISGIQYILLSIVTCGIYCYIWNFQMGMKIEKIEYTGRNRGPLFLILKILGLGWINDIILQSAINSKAEYR